VAQRVGAVHDVLLEVDRLAGRQLRRAVLQPLLDAALAHPYDLLLIGVAVEGVAGAGLQRDVHDAHRARPRELRAADPAGLAPVELVADDVAARDEPSAAHAVSWI